MTNYNFNLHFNPNRYTIAKGLYPIMAHMYELLKDRYREKQMLKYDLTHVTFGYNILKLKHNLVFSLYALDPLTTINFQVTHMLNLDNNKLYFSVENRADRALESNKEINFVSLMPAEFDNSIQTAEKRVIRYCVNHLSNFDFDHLNNVILDYQTRTRFALAKYAYNLHKHINKAYPREVAYLLNQSNSPLTLVSQYTTTEGLTHYELSCTGICIKVTYCHTNMKFDNLKIEDYIPHNAKSKMQAKLNVPIVLDLCKSLYSLS